MFIYGRIGCNSYCYNYDDYCVYLFWGKGEGEREGEEDRVLFVVLDVILLIKFDNMYFIIYLKLMKDFILGFLIIIRVFLSIEVIEKIWNNIYVC